jgi:ribonuclease Z
MSIEFRILGAPDEDNALLIKVDSGQAVEHLLFDCGDGCLGGLALGEIQSIDHLFFSHFHMDHVGGFDAFFRCNFNRFLKQNRIWGPPGTLKIMHHRFQGFLWNLHEGLDSPWYVSEIQPESVHTARFELSEAFKFAHDEGTVPHDRILTTGQGFTVQSLQMDHRTPSMAYFVREIPRRNVDMARLADLELNPGPWMKELREPTSDALSLEIAGRTWRLGDLREKLLVETTGDSIAYLTDFLLDDAAVEKLLPLLQNCTTVVCESQYRHCDLELARRNFHMTSVQAAKLAQQAHVGKLVLFHLSDRYPAAEWAMLLAEAREIFPATEFAPHWVLPV